MDDVSKGDSVIGHCFNKLETFIKININMKGLMKQTFSYLVRAVPVKEVGGYVAD